MKIDTIDFKPVLQNTWQDEEKRYRAVAIFINGKDLIQMMKTLEKPTVGDMAGTYIYREAEDLYYRLTTSSFGKPKVYSGYKLLAVCDECGVPGCWDLTIDSFTGYKTITWNLKIRDSNKILRFVFNKEDYIGKVNSLKKLISNE